jgi:hypothetical protein
VRERSGGVLEESAGALRRDPQVQHIYLGLGDKPCRRGAIDVTCRKPRGDVLRLNARSFRQFGRWMPLEGVVMSQ